MFNKGKLNRVIGQLPTKTPMATTAPPMEYQLTTQRLTEHANRAALMLLDQQLTDRAKRASELNSALIPGMFEHLKEYLQELRAITPDPNQILNNIPVYAMQVAKPHARQKMVDIAKATIKQTQTESVKLEKYLMEHLDIINSIQSEVKRAYLLELEDKGYHQFIYKPANESLHPMRVYEQLQTQIAKVAGLTGKHNTFEKLSQCPELQYITPDALEWYLVQCKYHGLITAQWNPHKEYHNYRPTAKGKQEYETYYGNRI